MRPVLAELLFHHRQRPDPEGRIASELLFNKQALALMHRHAARLAERPMRPFAGQVLLVERVAGFVQHAHQRGEEFAGAIARGDAHVGRHAAAEGMVRDREAAMGEVEADGRSSWRGRAPAGGRSDSSPDSGFKGDFASRSSCTASASGTKSRRKALSSAKTGEMSAARFPGSYCSISAS